MITDDSLIVTSTAQVSADIGGEVAVLSTESGIYYGLDAVGARIWELVRTPITVADLKQRLLSEFDVDEGRLSADLRSLLLDLLSHRLVEVAAAEA